MLQCTTEKTERGGKVMSFLGIGRNKEARVEHLRERAERLHTRAERQEKRMQSRSLFSSYATPGAELKAQELERKANCIENGINGREKRQRVHKNQHVSVFSPTEKRQSSNYTTIQLPGIYSNRDDAVDTGGRPENDTAKREREAELNAAAKKRERFIAEQNKDSEIPVRTDANTEAAVAPKPEVQSPPEEIEVEGRDINPGDTVIHNGNLYELGKDGILVLVKNNQTE